MNKLISKSILFILCLIVSLVFFACTKEKEPTKEKTKEEEPGLATPTGLKIDGTLLSFNEVEGATKYRIEITQENSDTVIRRFVSNNVDLNTLNIPEGDYLIKIQACNDNLTKVSPYSDSISYSQIDLYAINEIKGADLISGDYVKWMGRYSYNDDTQLTTLYYSASGFSVNVKKVEEDLSVFVTITATNSNVVDKRPYVVVVLDNDFEGAMTYPLTQQKTELQLIGGDGLVISDNEVHNVALYKRSESIDSHIAIEKINTTGKFIEGVEYKERKIEVIAASSSTGYGNLGNSSQSKNTSNSDALKAFAFLTSQLLDSEINIVSASGWGIYASRWTSPNTLNMREKYKYVDVFSSEVWDTTKYVPDVIVVNFGTNDLSYINIASTPQEKEERIANFKLYYVEFLRELKRTYPNAQLIILYGLMLESGIYEYTEEIYDEALTYIPDLKIVKILGDAKGCNSHPSAASHATIADTLASFIKETMGW